MKSKTTYFKGWARPGITPPGTLLAEPPVEEGETLDALSGNFKIYQLKDGHRYSTDDLLAAWYGTVGCPSPSKVLDLGSGIGSVGMIAAWRLTGAKFITIEAQAQSVALARKSAKYNGLEGRYEIRQGDFRDKGILSPDEKFDLILGSPPYFPIGTGIESEHPQKQACRFELRGNIADYCSVAAEHLEGGGVFACVFPIQPETQNERVLSAAQESGLCILKRRAIILREGEPPLLSVFLMAKREDLPEGIRAQTWEEPPLTIRKKDGSVHPEYQVVKLSIGFPP